MQQFFEMYEVLYLFNTGLFQWNPNITVPDPLSMNILFCQSIQSQDLSDIWKSYECLIFFTEKYHLLINQSCISRKHKSNQ